MPPIAYTQAQSLRDTWASSAPKWVKDKLSKLRDNNRHALNQTQVADMGRWIEELGFPLAKSDEWWCRFPVVAAPGNQARVDGGLLTMISTTQGATQPNARPAKDNITLGKIPDTCGDLYVAGVHPNETVRIDGRSGTAAAWLAIRARLLHRKIPDNIIVSADLSGDGPRLAAVDHGDVKAKIVAHEAPDATFYFCGTLSEPVPPNVVRLNPGCHVAELEKLIWKTDYHDVAPDDLPTWLAIPWHNFCEEGHSRVRLSWLLDTAEIAVRWTTALALAEAEHKYANELPDDIRSKVAEKIRQPSFKTWLDVLKQLEDHLPKDGWVFPKIKEWTLRLERLILQEKEGASLISLRNDVERVGSVSPEDASSLVDCHRDTLVGIMLGIRELMGDARIKAGGLLLHGREPSVERESNSLEPRVRVVKTVMDGERVLTLAPLLFSGPTQANDIDVSAKSSIAVHVFARPGAKNWLEYTSLGGGRFLTKRNDPEGYQRLFPEGKASEQPDFFADANRAASEFVGRSEELRVAKKWLEDRKVPAGVPRVGWISGKAGMGKSMLVAKLVSDWLEQFDKNKPPPVYYHRFRAGDHRNDRRSFIDMLREALWQWEPLQHPTDKPRTNENEEIKLKDVGARLKKLAMLLFDGTSPPPTFWIFVDGLDEIAQIEKGFPKFLRDLAKNGGVWMVAGRPDGDLSNLFTSDGAEAVFEGRGENGLPKMSAADIRTMLLRGLDFDRHPLLRRDEDSEDGGPVDNPFVNAVAKRADGLPIYVHYVIEDIRAGKLDVRSEDQLPKSLEAYYDAVVDRLGVNVTSLDLARILAVLACAREPLDQDALAALLAIHDHRPPEVDRELTDRAAAALQAGASLLRRVPSQEATEAWALYHHCFRDLLLKDLKTTPMVHTARLVLLHAASKWQAMSTAKLAPLRAHLFRWGTQYALDWGGQTGVDSAVKRLSDQKYILARTEALVGVSGPSVIDRCADDVDNLLKRCVDDVNNISIEKDKLLNVQLILRVVQRVRTRTSCVTDIILRLVFAVSESEEIWHEALNIACTRGLGMEKNSQSNQKISSDDPDPVEAALTDASRVLTIYNHEINDKKNEITKIPTINSPNRAKEICNRLRDHIEPLRVGNADSLRVARAYNNYGQVCHQSALLQKKDTTDRSNGFVEAAKNFELALERLPDAQGDTRVLYAKFIIKHNLSEADIMLGKIESARDFVEQCWSDAGENIHIPKDRPNLYPNWISEWGLPLLRILRTAHKVSAKLPDQQDDTELCKHWLREAGVPESAIADPNGGDMAAWSALAPLQDWLRGLRR